jgi:uncharacterized protein YjbI with pentapeptide repeats
MADEEQLRILKQGTEAWNAWRQQAGRETSIDLGGADLRDAGLRDADLRGADLRANLRRADLRGADIRGADLRRADLSSANLHGADLSMGDLREAKLSVAKLSIADLSGANLDRANFHRADLQEAKLASADLSGADFSGANLGGTILHAANLTGAILTGAGLRDADLREANLRRANLRSANLPRANLRRADLSHADLTGAVLMDTDLDYADFTEVNLDGANLGGTSLSDVDLSSCKNLELIYHRGPSTIDFRTLQRSGRLPLAFLRGVGLPDNLIEYLPSLLGQAIQHYSCFISYASADEAFARRLYADLQGKGVRCWFAPEDLKIGAKILDTLDEAIRLRDKVLLVLSEASIASEWVEDEVTKAFEEERQRSGVVLFPVRVDDAVFETKEAWATKLRAGRNIGDFRAWKDHDAYQTALKRVLRDLQVEKGDATAT